MNKMTKQGVRDLNSIPSKAKGVRLDPMPPEIDFNCKHKWQEDPMGRFATCSRCKITDDTWK